MPLLVIAGAGSGKTNTLAHRVAHLIVNGADPRNSADDLLAPGLRRDSSACMTTGRRPTWSDKEPAVSNTISSVRS